MSYNKDTDYQEKINVAVKSGDYKSAAKYEQSRNEKIDAENLTYEKTNNYSGWLDDTDYSNVIRDKIESGASKASVSDSLKKRIEKASGTVGLTQYAYDDVYDDAIKYIMGGDSFSYDARVPSYYANYDDDLSNYYLRLKNFDDFSYNPYSDELYKYYKEQYNREGKRAMEELIGELSMNTGGVASSYAVSAASQMLDEYNKKLTDKIPELYKAAYERYLDSYDAEKDNFETLLSLADREYEMYVDELEQYNKNRDAQYQMYTDSLDEEFRRKEFETKIEDTQTENDFREQELLLEKEENEHEWEQEDYENKQKLEQNEIDAALKKWEKLGYLDSESARVLGLPEGLHTSDYDYKQAQQYKIYNK